MASVAVHCLGPLFGTVFGTTDNPEKTGRAGNSDAHFPRQMYLTYGRMLLQRVFFVKFLFVMNPNSGIHYLSGTR